LKIEVACLAYEKMGVHDYSSAIYSRGELEGDQCLKIPVSDAIYSTDKNNEPITNDWAIHAEDEPKILEALAASVEIPDPSTIIEEIAGWEMYDGAGSSTAILELFTFASDIDSREEAEAAIASSQYSQRSIVEATYSWDDWDFKLHGKYLNYNEACDGDMPNFWKVPDNSANGCTWIRNYTEQEYDYYIKAKKPHAQMSNADLAYVAFLFDIDYRGKTRLEVFNLVHSTIAREFHIVE
jgi:hypothetical protein